MNRLRETIAATTLIASVSACSTAGPEQIDLPSDESLQTSNGGSFLSIGESAMSTVKLKYVHGRLQNHEQLSDEQRQKITRGIVRIAELGSGKTSTGFAVQDGEQELIITDADDLPEDTSSLRITAPSGLRKGKVSSISEYGDIAIITATKNIVADGYELVLSDTTANIGDTVTVFGNNFGLSAGPTNYRSIAVARAQQTTGSSQFYLAGIDPFDTKAETGYETNHLTDEGIGGPIVSMDGEVVALTTGTNTAYRSREKLRQHLHVIIRGLKPNKQSGLVLDLITTRSSQDIAEAIAQSD